MCGKTVKDIFCDNMLLALNFKKNNDFREVKIIPSLNALILRHYMVTEQFYSFLLHEKGFNCLEVDRNLCECILELT